MNYVRRKKFHSELCIEEKKTVALCCQFSRTHLVAMYTFLQIVKATKNLALDIFFRKKNINVAGNGNKVSFCYVRFLYEIYLPKHNRGSEKSRVEIQKKKNIS